jgi:hypothetical protein
MQLISQVRHFIGESAPVEHKNTRSVQNITMQAFSGDACCFK